MIVRRALPLTGPLPETIRATLDSLEGRVLRWALVSVSPPLLEVVLFR